MNCPDCNAEIVDEDSFCTACGAGLAAVNEPEASTDKSRLRQETTSGETADQTHIKRFSGLSFVLAIISAYFMAVLLYWSRVGVERELIRVQKTYTVWLDIGGSHYRVPLLSVYVVTMVVFGVIGFGTLKRNKPVWIAGIAWYILFLGYALYPPPVLWMVPFAGLGLYWGLRARNSEFDTQRLEDKKTGGSIPDETVRTARSTVVAGQAGKQGSIFSGVLWMLLLSVLLFWLPVLGPLIAGYVGGKNADGVGKALIAGVLPAVVIGGIFLTAGATLNLPVIGAVIGGGATLIVLAYSVTLLIGALIGGALS